jgi:quercetin dioxygenase-like cupin family protein
MQEPLEQISATISTLRKHIESFVGSINSALERTATSPELNVKDFFFKIGEGQMPSRLFRGEGTFNTLIIDECGIVLKQTLKAGGEFIAHSHPNSTEITLVTKGLIEEVLTGQVLKPGHCYRAESYQKHQYRILEDAILITTFIFMPAE